MNHTDNERPVREEPLYNIGVVARTTGIAVATLRVWERRYGFPDPARTRGGHRLYSERDIMRLLWIKARLDEGMQAGRAVRALQHLEREGQLPQAPLTSPAAVRKGGEEPALAVFSERLIAALSSHDLVVADQVLGEALALYPPENLTLDVIVPTMADIGQAWMDGRATVATEHLATNYLRHRLLMWMLTGPPPYRTRPVVLACAPGEWHEGSLLVLGMLLRRRGWPVAYLGQSVPLSDLATFVQQLQPPAVVLVAMMEEPARALMEWPNWLPEAGHGGRPIIGYGGRIFTEQPEWREEVPGTFLGATLQEGVEALERLLRETVSVV